MDLGRGNPVEHFPVDFSRQDPDVLKELIKSLGNDIVFIKCALGTAPERSISTEPVESKQFPFPQSFLLCIYF